MSGAGPDGTPLWDRVSTRCTEWARTHDVALRDAILLVPFAQLLAPARQAFARIGGWSPRVEATHTLAVSLAPPASLQADALSFDTAIDRLTAARLMRTQAWGLAWARRDPRGFEGAVGQVVSTAQSMALAGSAVAPRERAAHWQHGRELLGPQRGPGDLERRLARLALEWAAIAFEPASDRLFGLQPSAWMVVQAGGPDALVEALMAQADEATPCLVIDTDVSLEAPFAAAAHAPAPMLALCESFEHEAQCTAAQVLLHLQRGERPVALIAQDRVLVRRVRALLERAQVALVDETGWKLSTTRAAAHLMTLLRAAEPQASTDALFDWLKHLEVWPGVGSVARLSEELEAFCRRRQVRHVGDLQRVAPPPPLLTFCDAITALLAQLGEHRGMPIDRWLDTLARVLAECGALAQLQADDAGRQLLACLHLDAQAPAWRQALGGTAMDLTEFTHWVDGVLEAHAFHPAASDRDTPDVVITPLARAMLRPFAAMLLPGADDSRLGAGTATHALLPDAMLVALGLPDARAQRDKELLAFAHTLSVPSLTLLRRRMDGGQPLSDSPLVERLALELARHGHALRPWQDPRTAVTLSPTPVVRPSPSAPDRLPARLSASAAESLRDCPYRFFARHVLHVREDDELGDEIEKRDYGTWLHEVLHAFHAGRQAPADAADEAARLRALGREHQARLGLPDDLFVPFEASFEHFVPGYIAWLHARDAAGARWLHGERKLQIQPDELGGFTLEGIIDRIDEIHDAPGAALELIDYKTGSAESLKKKVKLPLEDTQLAFYAALMRGDTILPLRAIYLAVDGSKGLSEIRHPDVEASAQALVAGLAHDLQRLRAGAGMAALGEGRTCEYCEARGLCRRDHWGAQTFSQTFSQTLPQEPPS